MNNEINCDHDVDGNDIEGPVVNCVSGEGLVLALKHENLGHWN